MLRLLSAGGGSADEDEDEKPPVVAIDVAVWARGRACVDGAMADKNDEAGGPGSDGLDPLFDNFWRRRPSILEAIERSSSPGRVLFRLLLPLLLLLLLLVLPAVPTPVPMRAVAGGAVDDGRRLGRPGSTN